MSAVVRTMTVSKHAHFVLRLGLAFVFGWFGVDKFLNVQAWYGWIPSWLTFVPQNPFLYVLGVVEVIVALFLLLNKYVRFASITCAAFLVGVVLSFGINEITVRDIGLIAMALALALMPVQKKYHELREIERFVRRQKK